MVFGRACGVLSCIRFAKTLRGLLSRKLWREFVGETEESGGTLSTGHGVVLNFGIGVRLCLSLKVKPWPVPRSFGPVVT